MCETTVKQGGGVRDSGIELLRIVSMILIIAHHYVVNSGLMEPMQASPLAVRSILLFLFGAWGKTGINCFVLITGYFMCTSKITGRKFLKLILEIEFYKILIYIIFLIFGLDTLSLTRVVKTILPISGVGSGFTSAYLLFYLFIPFLNILICNLTQKQHLCLVALCLFIYTFLGTVPKIGVTMNYVSWFIVLYFIASFVRFYPFRFSESRKVWGLSALGALAISALSVVACIFVKEKLHYETLSPFYFVSDSNKVLALVTGFCAFMFFKNVHFKSKFINLIASATFGVLLIHANSDAMRAWLWGDLLNNVGQYNSNLLFVHFFGSVLAIYVICTLIDLARTYAIERPLFKWIDKKIEARQKKKEENAL